MVSTDRGHDWADELQAMKVIATALAKLPHSDARSRVLQWVSLHFQMTYPEPETEASVQTPHKTDDPELTVPSARLLFDATGFHPDGNDGNPVGTTSTTVNEMTPPVHRAFAPPMPHPVARPSASRRFSAPLRWIAHHWLLR
jgi:hypothetical protein